jgi:hypothetical protein
MLDCELGAHWVVEAAVQGRKCFVSPKLCTVQRWSLAAEGHHHLGPLRILR